MDPHLQAGVYSGSAATLLNLAVENAEIEGQRLLDLEIDKLEVRLIVSVEADESLECEVEDD